MSRVADSPCVLLVKLVFFLLAPILLLRLTSVTLSASSVSLQLDERLLRSPFVAVIDVGSNDFFESVFACDLKFS